MIVLSCLVLSWFCLNLSETSAKGLILHYYITFFMIWVVVSEAPNDQMFLNT